MELGFCEELFGECGRWGGVEGGGFAAEGGECGGGGCGEGGADGVGEWDRARGWVGGVGEVCGCSWGLCAWGCDFGEGFHFGICAAGVGGEGSFFTTLDGEERVMMCVRGNIDGSIHACVYSLYQTLIAEFSLPAVVYLPSSIIARRIVSSF